MNNDENFTGSCCTEKGQTEYWPSTSHRGLAVQLSLREKRHAERTIVDCRKAGLLSEQVNQLVTQLSVTPPDSDAADSSDDNRVITEIGDATLG